MAFQSIVYIKHEDVNSGSYMRVFCTKVVIGFNCKANVTPNANYGKLAEVQSQNMENPKYIITNIVLDYDEDELTSTLLKELIVANYTSTSPLYIKIKQGGSDWTAMDNSTTEIPVQIDGGINISLDTTDSTDAYLPMTNIPLVEQYEA